MPAIRDILALSFIPRLGTTLLSRVLSQDARASASVSNLEEVIQLLNGISKRGNRAFDLSDEILRHCYDKADKVLIDAAQRDLMVISILDDLYPRRLWSIPSPPPIIYVKGDAPCLHATVSIAIVGTRMPTGFGDRCAFRLGAVIGGAGAAVVSGLALGCDTAAHSGCITSGGKTVAVLAHGLDRIYPKQNELLADEILKTRGCLFSEYRLFSPPLRSHFIDRDKLQVALSDAVIVVETDVTGGTMHTVRFCLEQGKLLACIKHPSKYADQPQTQGNQLLLRRGQALPIFDQASLNSFWERVRTASSNGMATLPAKVAQLCFENGA